MSKKEIGYRFYDFMVLGTLLGVFGLVTFLIKDRKRFIYLFPIYAAYLFFAVSFYVGDQSTFYLPALTIFAIFLGYGLLGLFKLPTSKLKTNLVIASVLLFLVIAPVAVYHSLPNYIAGLDQENKEKWEERVVFTYGRRGQWEFQAKWQQEGKELLVKHYLNPNQRGDFTPREYGESILDSLPPDSVFVTGSALDWYAMAIIDYLKLVENRRPDVEHIHWEFPEEFFTHDAMLRAISTNVRKGPVFVSAPFHYEMADSLRYWFIFEPHGLVYQIKSK